MAEIITDNEKKTSMFLHGDLLLHIIEARSLPNMDLVSTHLRRCLAPCTPRATTTNHKHHTHRRIITSDPYVSVVVPQATLARTSVLKNSKDPNWNQKFDIPLAHPLTDIEFLVKDNDLFGAELIGVATISTAKLSSGATINEWIPILSPSSGKPPKPDTALHVEYRFVPFEHNPRYLQGIAGDPDHNGVTNTYFPLRKGSRVKLYQDAHVPDHMLPEIEIDGGKLYKQGKCWEDICYAISEAHHLIYIVGWSVFHKIKLIREPTRPLPRGGDLTLGELLKYKSEEGVRVLLLVWDDKTSQEGLGFTTVSL